MPELNVKICIGCASLTPATSTGDGFRCLMVRRVDYVTGGTYNPRANDVRRDGSACGPDARWFARPQSQHGPEKPAGHH